MEQKKVPFKSLWGPFLPFSAPDLVFWSGCTTCAYLSQNPGMPSPYGEARTDAPVPLYAVLELKRRPPALTCTIHRWAVEWPFLGSEGGPGANCLCLKSTRKFFSLATQSVMPSIPRVIMRFLLPRKTQMIKRVYVCHFQESLLQFKWFMPPNFTKRKTTSLLFALLKPSSVQLIILLSGKKGEFISNTVIFPNGNSYGIIKIPYLTGRETAAALIFSPVLGGWEGERLSVTCSVLKPCSKFQEKKWAGVRSEWQEYSSLSYPCTRTITQLRWRLLTGPHIHPLLHSLLLQISRVLLTLISVLEFNSVQFNTCVGLCIHHRSQDAEQFHHHKGPSNCPFIPTPTSLLSHSLSPPTTVPNPWKPLISSISIILAFQRYYINGILHYVTCWDWFLLNSA